MCSNARTGNGSRCTCPLREKFWEGFANAIERPSLFQDPRFSDRPARINHQEDLIALMTPIFKTKPRSEWCARLDKEGVPFSPVYDSSEALEDAQAKFLEIEVEAQHPAMGRFRTVRFPVNFDGQLIVRMWPSAPHARRT